jgi:cardiolipin synthase
MAIQPSKISKLNTVGQILFAGLLLGMKAFAFDSPDLVTYGGAGVAALTLASMMIYLVQWLRHFPDDAQ